MSVRLRTRRWGCRDPRRLALLGWTRNEPCSLPLWSSSRPYRTENGRFSISRPSTGTDASVLCRGCGSRPADPGSRGRGVQRGPARGGGGGGGGPGGAGGPPGGAGGPPGGAGGPPGGATHTLRLRGLRAADAGRYECQLNTDPKLSQIYNLTVTEGEMPRVEVWAEGPREVRARAGGVAALACAARVEPPAPDRPAPGPAPAPLRLVWLKDDRPLLPQGGVSMDTERAAGRAASRLALGALAPSAAGRYTCRASAQPEGEPPTGGEPPMEGEVHFTLHVLHDDDVGEMEAMQRDQSVPGGGAPRRSPLAAPLAAPLVVLLAARCLTS
ncbi:hypothetical protein MSG28_012535 [Choristoneura fumiferana]|uniref:Uncharacterized protein n=1 Tax=Choristoneura fumiferana TaxID=7141 RepID=A0ACC0KDJ3_CHOFU|nr:hypothetical protein MSG28_012535 [Choristoneura fumiferana]